MKKYGIREAFNQFKAELQNTKLMSMSVVCDILNKFCLRF